MTSLNQTMSNSDNDSTEHRPQIRTLEQLRDVINAMPRDDMERDEYGEAFGLPKGYWHDLADLPVFGGPEPEDTTCVWSWDETHLLVGECLPFEIVPRGRYKNS